MNIDHAVDLLNNGEAAIVLFTRGLHLELTNGLDGSGWSGFWVTKPNRHLPLHKVIIYNRPQGYEPQEAEVYIADYVDAEEASDPKHAGRVVVHFLDAEQKGTTDQNWHQFANTGTFPVRYIIGK